jgi:O-antigen/teichoic acid export membrane protein
MKLYAYSIQLPVIRFKRIPNLKEVLKYSILIIIAGSIAVMLLDVDKFMLGKYIEIENVAYYSVAIYIASVIGVPSRAMYQITNPITAQYLNKNQNDELRNLYKKSSLNLFIIGGLIFLLIILNINELYKIIPQEYSGGLLVVFLIGLVKLYDNLLGNNNAILFNSNYYRMVLVFGVFLIVLTVILNMIFIPIYGINGAAFATFLAVVLYNTAKLIFVSYKFKIHPLTSATAKTFVLILVLIAAFYFWEFPFHPLLNIALKSIIVSLLYLLSVYMFELSDDISQVIRKYLKI